MRIVQVAETLELGGMERLILALSKQHLAAGHDVTVYCIYRLGVQAEEAEKLGVKVRCFNKTRRWSFTTLARVTCALLRDKPDIVHSHNPGIHPYAALAAWLARVPVVVNTRHGSKTSEGHSYREDVFRWVAPLTDHVVAVSHHTREHLVSTRAISKHKSSVIYNGIDTAAFAEHMAAPMSAAPRIRFGTIGRLVAAKGHHVLVDAFKEVRERLPGAELHIVGSGMLQEQLMEHVKKSGLTDGIAILGMTRDPSSVLSNLDIFVLPSINEGVPLVILEAMAAGLPIVSTRVGGVPEVAPENEVATFCKPGDIASLASAMCSTATCGRLKQIGAAASELARNRYDIKETHKQYLRLFDGLLGGTA